MSSTVTSSSLLDDEFRGEELAPNADDNALRAAAEKARLPFDRPTEHELAFFPELWETRNAVDVFLMVRNATLATWQYNPLRECTVLDVRNYLDPPYNSDIDLIQNVVHFLTRHGLINFGRYNRATKIPRFLVRNERKVIVIGAGIAGISTALQLTSFGFDVTILEARNRMGGRAHSYKTQHGNIVETGADTFRHLKDSPISTLLQQVNIEEYSVWDYTSIYSDGKLLSEDRAQLFRNHYEAADGALNFEAHQREHRDENGRWISRQQAFENMMNMCERGTLIKYYNYTKSLEEVARAREHHYNQMKMCHNTAMLAENKLKRMEEQGLLENDPVLRRSLKRDVMCSMDRFDEVANAFEVTENHWQKLNDHPQAKQFMHPGSDFSTYNFMLGFEEYMFGAQLEKVQFSCDSALNKKFGNASRLAQGVYALFRGLIEKRKMDIRLNHRIMDIDYQQKDRVKLTVKKRSGDVEVMDAAFVVSTIPLGVLKKTVVNDERAPKFTPPLPDDKIRAIRRMGFGVVNKVILEFERPFWANATSTRASQFVTISPNIKVRGSMCLWSSIPRSNVLTTYIVGETADHEIPNDVIVHNAMSILQKVFGNQCPRVPLAYNITRWQDDEFAFGSGAYMGLNTEKVDFDDLMKPLQTQDGKNRVYFAGEHTCSAYTASIQGAWMSGARAAADMANDHIGVGFVDLSSLDADDENADGMEIITIDHDGPMEGATGSEENGASNGENGPDAKRAKTSEEA